MLSCKNEQPSALFGDEKPSTSPQIVSLKSISLPARQPRRYFDPEQMEQLTQSVKVHGILENLVVRPLKDQNERYELIAGGRRYQAALAAQLEEVPVTIREMTDEQALQVSLVENLLREDLNPVEETEGILQLLAIKLNQPIEEIKSLLYRMHHATKGEDAQNVLGSEEAQSVQAVFEQLSTIGWTSFVTSRLPLLNLPTEVLEMLRAGKIEYTKATAIAKVKEDSERKALLNEAIASNLSLSEIRERIKALSSKSESNSSTSSEKAEKRVKKITQRLNRSKIWEDGNKWEQAEPLLQKLEDLIEKSALKS